MATAIEMPKLGNTVEECLLAKWNKRKGDRVSSGEIIAEIETDKATFEITAPGDGTILETYFGEGELVPVYTNICVIGEPGEDTAPYKPKAAAPRPAARDAALPAAPKAPAPAATAAPRSSPVAVVEPDRGVAPAIGAAPSQVYLSPRARRFARAHDFNPPVNFRGSGPNGRILEKDLQELYYRSPKLSPLAKKYAEAGYEVRSLGTGIGGMVLARDLNQPPVRMSGIRERTARRMRESLTSTAQYTLNTSAGATGLLSLRSKVKAARETRKDIPDVNLNDMVMFCTVKALLDMPELNAELIDGKIYKHQNVNIGFACDTPKGLLVAVIKESQKLSLAELSLKIKALTTQAGEGNLTPGDMSGATFTVSNLGNLGIESFTPILNPPQVAILGVDTIELKPVRRNGKVDFVDYLGLSLTLDHQVIDGAPGARFLKVVREYIEKIETISDLKL